MTDPFAFKPKNRSLTPTTTNENSIFVDVEQNTDEWQDLRLKKITSSNFGKIMANEGKPFGKPAVEYAQQIALEYVTGKRDDTGYKSPHMERGHEFEDDAIKLYEKQQGVKVSNGGFYYEKSDDKILLGDSPDGNVFPDGCVEVKTRIPKTHWERMRKGGIDSVYKWQVHGHIFIGEKKWCDFIDYCPEFPDGKKLLIFRVFRDDSIIESMQKRLSEFKQLVLKHIKLLEE